MNNVDTTDSSADTQAAELQALMRELADESAISDIQSFCNGARLQDGTWWNTNSADSEGERFAVTRALHYLTLRGRLQHKVNLTAWVKILPAPEDVTEPATAAGAGLN